MLNTLLLMCLSMIFCFLYVRLHPRAPRTDTLLPSPTPSDLGLDSGRRGRQHRQIGNDRRIGERAPRTMLLHRAGVVAARLLKRDRHRAAGIGGVRTDAHGDRPAGVTLDHPARRDEHPRSEEHTSELQSLMRSSYADFCWKKNKCQTRK